MFKRNTTIKIIHTCIHNENIVCEKGITLIAYIMLYL
jgi:hypothetical protein